MDDRFLEYETAFREAVGEMWKSRDTQAEKQRAEGKQDAGARGSVTGGKHFESIEALLTQIVVDAGIPENAVFKGVQSQLPGFFRQQKNWDFVVIHNDIVVACIECKSQGSSFGKNLNNRIEEAIGQTVDFWQAHVEGFIPGIRPWFGYVMVVEASEESTRPVHNKYKPFFETDPAFDGLSYVARFAECFSRLVQQRELDAACFASSNPSENEIEFANKAMCFSLFSMQLFNRCKECLELGTAE